MAKGSWRGSDHNRGDLVGVGEVVVEVVGVRKSGLNLGPLP